MYEASRLRVKVSLILCLSGENPCLMNDLQSCIKVPAYIQYSYTFGILARLHKGPCSRVEIRLRRTCENPSRIHPEQIAEDGLLAFVRVNGSLARPVPVILSRHLVPVSLAMRVEYVVCSRWWWCVLLPG